MRDLLTDLLDALGLLVLAAGLGLATLSWRHGMALSVAGAVVLGGSWLASRPVKPAADR